MSDSNSEASPQTTTTTQNEDNRVAAEAGGVAIGAGAVLDLRSEFSDNVKTAFLEALELARRAGQTAIDFSKMAIDANKDTVNAVAERAKQAEDKEQYGKSALLIDILPTIAIVLVVGLIVTGFIFRGKR